MLEGWKAGKLGSESIGDKNYGFISDRFNRGWKPLPQYE